jgi:hypothetical protein
MVDGFTPPLRLFGEITFSAGLPLAGRASPADDGDLQACLDEVSSDSLYSEYSSLHRKAVEVFSLASCPEALLLCPVLERTVQILANLVVKMSLGVFKAAEGGSAAEAVPPGEAAVFFNRVLNLNKEIALVVRRLSILKQACLGPLDGDNEFKKELCLASESLELKVRRLQ